MWSGGTKTGWVATNSTPTSTLCHIHSTKDSSNKKTTTRSCPTLCSYPPIAIKNHVIVYTKKRAKNAR